MPCLVSPHIACLLLCSPTPSILCTGFVTAVAVLSAVHALLPLKVRWVCQQQPNAATVPNLLGSGLDIEFVVSPSQVGVAVGGVGVLVGACLFTSRYQPWGMLL